MEIKQKKHSRRSTRLQGYDYSQEGAYFLTVCTHERACLFGEISDGVMRLNEAGKAVEGCWLAIPKHFPSVVLDVSVVMPNHLHGILFIMRRTVGAKDFSPLHPFDGSGRRASGTASGSIGSVVRGFKIGVTQWFRGGGRPFTVWQRNYYDHVIRSEESLNRIRQYIVDNPARWTFDRDNPSADQKEPKGIWFD